MGLKHQVLASIYPALELGHFLKSFTRKDKAGRLRVLVYHDVWPNEMDKFEAQIKWLMTKKWKFIDAATFSEMVAGDQPIIGDNLLLTFDDGFSSNLLVADEILEPLGIKAIFFVVAGFVDQCGIVESHRFIAKGIRSDLEPSIMPSHWLNMDWSDLKYLLVKGHTIGAHTETHARLSELREESRLVNEIIDSADKLESKLGVRIDHFAFTFGDSVSLSRDALRSARRRFKFTSTSLRGNNSAAGSPFSIYRETVSPIDGQYLIGSFLAGGADWMYSKAKEKYRQYL